VKHNTGKDCGYPPNPTFSHHWPTKKLFCHVKKPSYFRTAWFKFIW